MLIYANLCKWGWSADFKMWWTDFNEVSIGTKNTSVGDLVEKLEDFIFFGLKYVNLC